MIEEPFGTRVNFPPPPTLWIPKFITETQWWIDFESRYLGKRAKSGNSAAGWAPPEEAMARESTGTTVLYLPYLQTTTVLYLPC
jgi:hypothetical protein